MGARELARGGLLAAAAVALMYLGGVSPAFGAAACILAGVCSAVPLMKNGSVKMAVLLYLAASVLSALLVPKKGMAAAYIVFAGLYPILKYAVEARLPRGAQRPVKLVYANAVMLAAYAAVRFGLFPQVQMQSGWRLFFIWVGLNAVFEIYDIGLSRLIATLRRTLPPE